MRGAQKGTYSQLPPEDVEVIQRLPVAPEPGSIVDAQIASPTSTSPGPHACPAMGRALAASDGGGSRQFLQERLGSTFFATVWLGFALAVLPRFMSTAERSGARVGREVVT